MWDVFLSGALMRENSQCSGGSVVFSSFLQPSMSAAT